VIDVRPITEEDRPWTLQVERDSWGEPVVARLGQLIDPTRLPGFIALVDEQRAGLVSYALRGDECEVVTIRSLREGRRIGRALLDAVRDVATEAGCRRLWLVTTNNNLQALALFQKWGMEIVAFHRHGVSNARKRLKPSIPNRDAKGIPIVHELELELRFEPRRPSASSV
jgi:ribosomal protein S18 acetylase RimI-like enzyme